MAQQHRKLFWTTLRRNESNRRTSRRRESRARSLSCFWLGPKAFQAFHEAATRERPESGPKNDESAIRAVRHAWKATCASARRNVRAEEISSIDAGRHCKTLSCSFEKILGSDKSLYFLYRHVVNQMWELWFLYVLSKNFQSKSHSEEWNLLKNKNWTILFKDWLNFLFRLKFHSREYRMRMIFL